MSAEVSLAPGRDVRVNADIAALARSAAADTVALLSPLVAEVSRAADASCFVEVAISGGFVAQQVLPALLEYRDVVDWSRVRIWWVDERFVAAGHPDRNDAEAIDACLGALPGIQLVPMPSEEGQGLNAAATSFLEQWTSLMGERTLDLVLLGMGPDGHIASLFPGHDWRELGASTPDVYGVDDSPKPPPQRITLSMPVICRARNIFVLAAGEAKAEVIAEALTASDTSELPIAHVAANADRSATIWYLDAGSASQLY